ncbi:SRPBCC family protein [Intrasporangium mesophilum]
MTSTPSTPSTANSLSISAPEGELYFDIAREFDAPVADVFEAHRDPEKICQWLGPDGYDMRIDRYDFTSGGGYRYVHTNPAGEAFGFHGVFHAVRENQLAIQTFEFEMVPDVVALETLVFEDLGDGRTRLRIHSVYPNQESRDAMTQSGMDQGLTQGYARLDALLAGATADATADATGA